MSAVFPVLFALLSVAGAFAAWRHNPLYSGRATLRALALMVLAIGVFIGALVAAVDLTIHRSPAVIGAVMAAVVIFGALSLIFIIQAVSTPTAAQLRTTLPPGAAPLQVHRRKVYRWAQGFAAVVAACAIPALLIPGDIRFVPLVIGGMALLLGVILLPVMYVQARRFDLSLSALEYSPWVHWTYTPAQWAEWCRIQAERAQPQARARRDWRTTGITLAALVAGILFLTPGGWRERALYALFCGGALAAIVVGSDRDRRRQPGRLQARLRNAAPEAWFGHDGLYCNGVYTTWLALDMYLTAAAPDPRQPPSLNFSFVKSLPTAYGSPATLPLVQSVPVPAAGAAQDLSRLQQELSARCPTAQINVTTATEWPGRRA